MPRKKGMLHRAKGRSKSIARRHEREKLASEYKKLLEFPSLAPSPMVQQYTDTSPSVSKGLAIMGPSRRRR
jgi:hypothetical protein